MQRSPALGAQADLNASRVAGRAHATCQTASCGSVLKRRKDSQGVASHALIMVAGELAITRNVPLDFYEPHCHGARGTPRVHARRFVFLNGQIGHVLPPFASQAGAYAGSQSPTPGGAAVGPISLTMVGYTSVQNGTPSHLYSNRATRRARCLSHRFSAELAAVELATCPSPTSGDRTYHSYRSFGTAKLRFQRMWCGRRTARRLGFRSSMVSAGLLFCSKCLALEPCCLPWSPPRPVRNASEPISCRRIVP